MKNAIKYFVFSVIISLGLMACDEQRTTYEINGVAEEFEDGFVVELYNDQTKQEIAKTQVKDGKFHFEGSVEQAHLATLDLGRSSHSLVLENAEYNVLIGMYYNYADGGEINNKVFGYTLDDKYQQMKKEHALAPYPFKGVDFMNKEQVEKSRETYISRLSKEWEYSESFQRKILEGDNSTLVKLFTLNQISDWANYDYDRRFELLDDYEKELGAHPLLVQQREDLLDLKKREEMLKTVAAGKKFKEITGQTKEGEQLKLSEVVAKNKYTLLEMWSSWCGPCRGEFPHLKKAYAHYHKKGFEIFALSLDTKEKAWLKALDEEKVPWINVVDYKGLEGEGPKAYVISGIPASFLIDQNGIIIATSQEVRGFGLDEKLEELLGK